MTIKDVVLSKHDSVGKSEQKQPSNSVRTGIWILIVALAGFIIWAAFAPLDEGVPSEGVVSIATKPKVIQHLQGGRVDRVHVREGQFVREGAVLITLDNLLAKARYEEVHQHYLGLRAAESRLLAEQNASSHISFHHDLLTDDNKLLVERLMQSEKQLFVARQGIVRLLKEQLSGIRDLVREGYAPLNQQRDLEIRLSEIYANIQQEMSQVQREVQADKDKSVALAEELSLTEITSPVAGQVLGLQVQTAGAVIQSGQKLMDIVPLDEKLLVEVKIAPHLIDRVHTGGIADVRFTSFAHSPQLVVSGKVESVSKDLITDPRMNPAQPGSSYYLARISISPEGLKTLGNRQLQPGMHVEAVIKTGERSLLTYLMHPLIKRLSASMKEE